MQRNRVFLSVCLCVRASVSMYVHERTCVCVHMKGLQRNWRVCDWMCSSLPNFRCNYPDIK